MFLTWTTASIVFSAAIVKSVTHFNDPAIIAEVSKGLGDAMSGIDVKTLNPEDLLATRGW